MSENNGWLPIETAPKDGTAVLLFEPAEDRYLNEGLEYGPKVGQLLCMGVGTWCQTDSGEDYWGDYHDLNVLMSEPTHWHPLPPPPETHTQEA